MDIKVFTATKAFIIFNGKVLILRESSAYADGANAAKYDVPGGRVIPGQRFDDSLLREVQEETGLSVTIQKPFFVNEWRPVVRGEQWQIIGTFFICTPTNDDVHLSQDHDDFQWIDPTEYKKFQLIENLHSAFESYLQQR